MVNKKALNRSSKRRATPRALALAILFAALNGVAVNDFEARAQSITQGNEAAREHDAPLVLSSEFELYDEENASEFNAPIDVAPEPIDPEFRPAQAREERRRPNATRRAINPPDTIPGASNRVNAAAQSVAANSASLSRSRAYAPAANAPAANAPATRALATSTVARTRPATRERIASISMPTATNAVARRRDSQTPNPQTSEPQTAAPRPKYAQNAENRARDAALEQRPETLEDAVRVALIESRAQRALALKRDAAQSATEAAAALRRPKINATASYVALVERPTTVSDVDLTNAVSQFAGSLSPETIAAIGPALANFPTSFQIATPLTDRNFVATSTTATIPLYLGGRIRALEETASATTQALAAGVEVGEQSVKLAATEAYFLTLRARRLHDVAVEAVQAAQEHLRNAEKMENVGVATKNVVLAAQVALAEAQQLELRVGNMQSLAESAYNKTLWRPLDAPVLLADVELDAPLGDFETLAETAVRTRSELRALNAETRALQAQVKLARADVLPQVAAVGGYSYFQNSRMKENSNAGAAIGVTWTPFDGGVSRARQQSAQQSATALARLREDAEANIRLQVRQATLAETEARERLNVARAAAEHAEENYRVATRGFQEGTLNHSEVLDAATMRTAAKSALANAKYDAVLATARLKFAVGIL